MAKSQYKVLTGIDYPPNKRAEAGDIVDDIPKSSVSWLIEAGAIERVAVSRDKASDFQTKSGSTPLSPTDHSEDEE